MSLKLYNTATRQKEDFKSIIPGEVKMYVCGPTVYNYLHIGNFRGAIFFNLVRNWLERAGYKVTYVYNYTDVDDKIIKKANEEGVESIEISERYIKEFEKDFNRLGLKKHEHNPKVTDFMPQIISFVDDLVKKGMAYVIDGEVFYEIKNFPSYGKLSGKNLEDLEAGARVEVDSKKHNPADFVLWKPAKPDEPYWDSPWGKGRPGWHIECSAMIQSILGETIDIHGGGIDLKFPHHENEIAQGEGRTGKCYCNHWMHNDFLNMNDEKMSKSLGNIITGRDFMEKYHPEILKFLMLSNHYRALFNVNDEKISGVLSGLSRIYAALRDATTIFGEDSTFQAEADKGLVDLCKTMDGKIEESLNDDFNTPEVMAHIFEVVRYFNGLELPKKKRNQQNKATCHYFFSWVVNHGQLMALFNDDPGTFLSEMDEILLREKKIDVAEVENLIAKRKEARDQKDFNQADAIRDQLNQMGIIIMDGVSGRGWEVDKK